MIMGYSFNPGFAEEPEPMNGEMLERIIRSAAGEETRVDGPVIAFVIHDIPLFCIYDESHDRMRIISPIRDYSEVTEEQKDRIMESNFHNALDARYASSDGVLYAAYIHPLSPLREQDILAAIYQVLSLNLSFGSEYSSGLLNFGGEEEKKPPGEDVPDEDEPTNSI